jgi:hypothetical protein
MTAPAPSPASPQEPSPQGGAAVETPKRSKRMIFWLVAVPVVMLLLAFAGANWKVFHLAYCKHLMRNADPGTRLDGLQRLGETHLVKGMSREEVSRMVRPLKLEVVGNRMKSLIAYFVGTWAPGESGQGLQVHFAGGKYEGCSEMLLRRVEATGKAGACVRLLIVGRAGSDAKVEYLLNAKDLLKTDVADWPGQHR